MSLSPISLNTETTVPDYSLTWKLDLETQQLDNRLIDAEAAVRQSIYKIINTPRNHYSIYSSDYGCDVEKILAESLPFNFLRDEIPRELRTSLMMDSRIKDVRDFTVTQVSDGLHVTFLVELVNGLAFTEGVRF